MTRRQKYPVGMRTRARTDGTTRAWWEPNAAARALGFKSVDLDGTRLTWSAREAERINREVEAARRGDDLATARKRGRTIEDLIEHYRRSRKFDILKSATKPGYLSNLRIISEKWGAALITDFSKPVIYAWYETLAETRGRASAVALIRMMSVLFSHAERIGWRAENSNPCSNLGMEIPKPRRTTISWAQIDLLTATADKLGHKATGTAILMSALQGQRQTDIIEATRAAFAHIEMPGTGDEGRAWVWQLTRSKRGTEGVMLVHPELVPRVVAAVMARPDPADKLLIDELSGRAFTPDTIKKRWITVRAVAAKQDPALAAVQFRDLRRTFGVLARASGASREDVGDVLGNSAATDPRLGDTYMPASFYTASRAVMALKRPATKEPKKA